MTDKKYQIDPYVPTSQSVEEIKKISDLGQLQDYKDKLLTSDLVYDKYEVRWAVEDPLFNLLTKICDLFIEKIGYDVNFDSDIICNKPLASIRQEPLIHIIDAWILYSYDKDISNNKPQSITRWLSNSFASKTDVSTWRYCLYSANNETHYNLVIKTIIVNNITKQYRYYNRDEHHPPVLQLISQRISSNELALLSQNRNIAMCEPSYNWFRSIFTPDNWYTILHAINSTVDQKVHQCLVIKVNKRSSNYVCNRIINVIDGLFYPYSRVKEEEFTLEDSRGSTIIVHNMVKHNTDQKAISWPFINNGIPSLHIFITKKDIPFRGIFIEMNTKMLTEAIDHNYNMEMDKKVFLYELIRSTIYGKTGVKRRILPVRQSEPNKRQKLEESDDNTQ